MFRPEETGDGVVVYCRLTPAGEDADCDADCVLGGTQRWAELLLPTSRMSGAELSITTRCINRKVPGEVPSRLIKVS